jgi:carbamoyl-phosphate synthase large subunit
VPTVQTYGDIASAEAALAEGIISFPVFVKPRTGSGSVGARKVHDLQALRDAFEMDPGLIAQEYMGDALDLDADVYVDTVSHETVAVFTKRKLETKIGGASKTVSFKDEKLVRFLVDALKHFSFNGPIDVDVFCRNGEYYLSEVNPRFGGAYLHAYGAGVDFIKLIENNVKGISNAEEIGNYDEGVVMMMYDSVVIKKANELVQ